MKSESSIICPNCTSEIDVNEVLYAQLKTQVNRELEQKQAEMENAIREKNAKMDAYRDQLKKERDELKLTVEKEVGEKLRAERLQVEQRIREQLAGEQADVLKSMQDELTRKSEQLRELNKTKAELEQARREKEELRETIQLEKEKEYTEKLSQEKAKIKQHVEEETMLRLKEREKVIDDLKHQLEEAKRKAEQGSMQLQGEIQELELEQMLREMFVYDEIEEVKKGQRGADTIQVVKTQQGTVCGKIYYESKRTKNFDNNWLQKLRDDNLSVKADILVLVTETMPDGHDRFFFRDGVWICSLHEAKGLAMVLRYGLIQVHQVAVTQHGKEGKMEMLYNYLTGQEFAGQFGAIIEGFKALQENYADEKLKMQKVWKEREKQLEKILTNAVHFYGSIKGIAGASIPSIKMLEGQDELPE